MGLYSHYDGAHNHPVNRALHLIAIPLSGACVRGTALDGAENFREGSEVIASR